MNQLIIILLSTILITSFLPIHAEHIEEKFKSTNVINSKGVEYEIPAWVNHLAYWWGIGEIDTYDYVNALQWLIDHDIIKVKQNG